MERRLKMLETKNLAFLDYYAIDDETNKGIRQFSVFDCAHKKADGTVYYRDLCSDIVYILKADDGQRMQEAPVLIDNYNKIAYGYGKEDLLFKAESTNPVAGDIDAPSNEVYADRFQILAKDMKFRDSWKYAVIAGKLRKEQIDETELAEMVQAFNENERKLTLSGKLRRGESFKRILGRNVTRMVDEMSLGLESLDERFSNDNNNEMGE